METTKKQANPQPVELPKIPLPTDFDLQQAFQQPA